jgi:hypothetical protein
MCEFAPGSPWKMIFFFAIYFFAIYFFAMPIASTAFPYADLRP